MVLILLLYLDKYVLLKVITCVYIPGENLL